MNEKTTTEPNIWKIFKLYGSYYWIYLPSVLVIWGYYFAWYYLASNTTWRVITLFSLLALEIPVIVLTIWLGDKCLFEKKMEIEKHRLKKRLAMIFRSTQVELSDAEIQFLRVHTATKTEQPPSAVPIVAMFLSLITFVLSAASDLVQDLSDTENAEVIIDDVTHALDLAAIASAKFEYLILLLPLLFYALYQLVSQGNTSKEKTIRESALQRINSPKTDDPRSIQKPTDKELSELESSLKLLNTKLDEINGALERIKHSRLIRFLLGSRHQ